MKLLDLHIWLEAVLGEKYDVVVVGAWQLTDTLYVFDQEWLTWLSYKLVVLTDWHVGCLRPCELLQSHLLFADNVSTSVLIEIIVGYDPLPSLGSDAHLTCLSLIFEIDRPSQIVSVDQWVWL